jgi:hypothetical protein
MGRCKNVSRDEEFSKLYNHEANVTRSLFGKLIIKQKRKNATNALTKKHPDNSYIAKIDDNGKLTVYDLSGNEVRVAGLYWFGIVSCCHLNACRCILLKCLRCCKLGSLLRQ